MSFPIDHPSNSSNKASVEKIGLKKGMEKKLEDALKSGLISEKSPLYEFLLGILQIFNELLESSKTQPSFNNLFKIKKERNLIEFLNPTKVAKRKNTLPPIDFSIIPLDSSTWPSKSELENIFFPKKTVYNHSLPKK